MATVRKLYESFGTGGLYGRPENPLDAMSPSEVADYLVCGQASYSNASKLAAVPSRRLFEDAAPPMSAPPMTTGGDTSALGESEDGDLHSALVEILDSGDDSGPDVDDGNAVAMQESLAAACRRGNVRQIVETAARLKGHHHARRVADYLRGNDNSRRMAMVGCPMRG